MSAVANVPDTGSEHDGVLASEYSGDDTNGSASGSIELSPATLHARFDTVARERSRFSPNVRLTDFEILDR
jgi:hypothetical protein